MIPTPELPKSFDSEKVYEPLEDSFLILDVLELEISLIQSHQFTHLVPLCVEVGSGSGIISTFLKKHVIQSKGVVVLTDVNPHACIATRDTSISNNAQVEPIQCDLLSIFPQEAIDLLIFNPPYVPAPTVPDVPESDNDDRWLDLALDGGSDGMVVTERLLLQLKYKISINGVVFILFCERNKPQQVIEKIISNPQVYGMWDIKQIEYRKCGWEVLSIYKLIKINR